MVLRFSSWHFSAASEVMNEINSETHSCTHSFASFAIFEVGGTAPFMIRETLAIWRESEGVCRGLGLGKTNRKKSVLLTILADLLLSDGGRIYGDGESSGTAFVMGWNDTLQLRHSNQSNWTNRCPPLSFSHCSR